MKNCGRGTESGSGSIGKYKHPKILWYDDNILTKGGWCMLLMINTWNTYFKFDFIKDNVTWVWVYNVFGVTIYVCSVYVMCMQQCINM